MSPKTFHLNVIPDAPFLVFPSVSASTRSYMPIGWLEPPVVPSNLLMLVEGASLSLFGLLQSSMHMAWMRGAGGRLKSDYRYSAGLVYNTFPPPEVDEWEKKLESLSHDILREREKNEGEPLGSLYTDDLMPSGLRDAHKRLDSEVDRLYQKGGFNSESERLDHLLEKYASMVGA